MMNSVCRGDGTFLQALQEGFEIHALIDQHRDNQRIDGCHCRGLGGGEPAQRKACQNDHGGDAGGQRMNELTRQIAQVESGALVAALDGVDIDEHHHQHCHDQRRDHTAHKQLGHTDRGRRAVYDQRDRGREDGADD